MTTEAPHWGYTGLEGPEHWGCLSEAYRPCSDGVQQSPVNITDCVETESDGIRFAYSGGAIAARNNGHTVYLDFPSGNFLEIDGQRYELQGVHFHSPAEHQVNGESFAAELHLVHQDTNGSLAVVGLLFRLGDASSLAQAIIDAAPPTGVSADLAYGCAACDFVLPRLEYYGYDGSLTTPPCSEGVRWVVMQSVGTVSRQQVESLQSLTGGPNNRPVQPLGARSIYAVAG